MTNAIERIARVFAVLCALAAGGAFAASTGSYMGKAGSISVGATKTVKLVQEYYGDGDYGDGGIYYLKVKLNKDNAYTVTAKGCDGMYVDTDGDDEKAPMASFMDYMVGDSYYSVLEASAWDEDDPSSGTFYIVVDGAIGDSVTVSVASGNNLPSGIPENPRAITVSDKAASTGGSLIDGEYYFITTLDAGRKYFFTTSGGTDANPLSIVADSDSDSLVIDNASAGVDSNNVAIVVYPSQKDAFSIQVSGEGSGAFNLSYSAAAALPVGSHSATELTAENGYAANIEPGYTHDPKSSYYDNIVDEGLCKATLEAGKNYIFETSGAATNLVLTVYDSKGTLDASKTNTGVGGDAFDVLAAISPTASGVFYFGVAQDIDELGINTEEPEVPAYLPVSVTLREVTLEPDETTGIAAVPAESANADPVEVDTEGVGPFALDDTHWTKTFAIGARSGITYRLKARIEEKAYATLKAEVFTKSGTKETAVSASGSLDPSGNGLVIAARANTTYYVRVSVAEGQGLPYPDFTMHCSATSTSGAALGTLQVDIKGAAGQWSINSESAKYDGGVSILASGTVTVKFTKVTGFSQPANRTVVMEQGKTETVTGIYSDTSDPKDDTAAGATKLTVSAKEGSAMRTLFAEDEADHFTFSAKEGVYYNFSLSDVAGDCVFSVTNAETGIVCENETSVSKLQLPPSKLPYYVVVAHGNDVAEDGSYTLTYSSANVGAIKFAKTSISVKENAAYADIAVSRTAKEGAVRVRFGTVAGTAKPGSEYYPTNGVLEWAANDSKAKTIRVRLIPDVTPVYEGGAKFFSVQLKALEEDELEEGEYPAQILTESAAVALTEVSKKTPGTISVTSYNGGDEDVAVAAPKKPAVEVTAGETLALKLARSGGADGVIGVKVAVAKGTASPGTDFELTSTNELVWADGDASEKTISIATYPAEATGSYAESKAFTVKLTALTGKSADGTAYDRATLAGASVAATIRNDVVQSSVETYSKGLAKGDGIALAGSKKGSWFVDDMGELRSVPLSANEKLTMTFTLTGPGFFKATPSLSDTDGGAYITATAGKTDLGNVVDEDVALIVPAGSTKVVFTVNAGSKAGVVTDGEALDIHASFAKFDAGDASLPYFWVPLSSVAALSPAEKSVSPADLAALEWDAPVALEDESGFFYRVSLDSDQKKLGTTNALFFATTQNRSVSLDGLPLEAGKQYFWRVDYGYSDDSDANSVADWTAPKAAWTFSTAAAGAPATVVVSGVDATGAEIAPSTTVALVQGVNTSFAVGATNTEAVLSYAVLSGKLPDGLKLDAKTGVVSGVPTKAGSYTALLQAKAGRVAGSSVALMFDVAALTTAVGTFNGVFAEDGSALTNGLPAIGSVTFTATEAGKLSAKVALGGKNYTFAATGYDNVTEDRLAEGDPETDYSTLAVTLTQLQKVGKVVYTNTLELAMTDAATNNIAALGSAAGKFVLTMAVPDMKGSGVQEDVVFTGSLWRDNSKLPNVLAAEEAFEGYYTVALAPSGTSATAPQGYGYLTLTLDAKGKVKVAGALADGTKVSGSAVAALAGTLSAAADNLDRELVVPFAMVKSPYCFGGEIRIFLQEAEDGSVTPVVDSTALLTWNNDDAAATYDGEEGWRETLAPVGGWYDTLVNLQAYYLNCTFLLDVSEDLPEELLADGYSFAASCSPNGMGVDVAGDVVSVAKKTLVKQEGSTKLNDLEASVNPWDVKVSFKRATGIVNGSFSAWTEGVDAKGNAVQKEIRSIKHDGVLILNRDAEAPLAEDVWTAGHYLVPVTLPSGNRTRKWNCSLPFSIKAVDQGEIDWYAEDWGEPEMAGD